MVTSSGCYSVLNFTGAAFYRRLGFDHGVGHPHLLLSNAKVPNYRNNKAFKDLSHYSEWPEVADAVIEAEDCVSL